jgi:hypothetical protein
LLPQAADYILQKAVPGRREFLQPARFG